ncbi:MAG TPA: NPCBM/NEW2 domain-containing protein, partial [Vicinamibacterales bacterium]|nr:NPCBM/NEW2 domain-containing protein [Vicinamibacterales bacterium]
NDYWDRGLLGIAADADFALNGYVYLFYVHEDDPFTYSGPKTARLVRVTAVGDTASPSSEVVLLGAAGGASCLLLADGADCIPADGPSHNGGAIRIAPDGTLWVAIGDASSFTTVDPRALRVQSLDTLAGKLLHIDRDGHGLASNPFFTGHADDVRSKIFAYGFRNPFRFALRPATGRPYVADVGSAFWEELNVAQPGANYGWPCYEGPASQPGYQSLAACQMLIAQGPAAVANAITGYPHLTDSASITGGAFYTGTALPEIYRGAYFFADFVRQTLSYVAVDDTDTVAGPIRGLATDLPGPVDVQTSATGILYLAVYTGELRQIRYVPDTGADITVHLGDAPAVWTSSTNGAGPVELDRSHGAGLGGDGTTMRLAGVSYPKGLGVKAPSDLRFPLGGVCTTFRTTVGIDDETGGTGSVTLQIWLDGALVAASGVVTGATPPITGTLDVTGQQELRLVVTDAGDGSIGDHVDWANAQLDCTRPAGDGLAPLVTVVSPPAGAIAAPLTATISAEVSEALAPGSVNSVTVRLVAAGGAPVMATVAYDAANRKIRLTPTSPLAPATAYTVSLLGGPGGLTDLGGNVLASTVAWTFTTVAAVVNQRPVPVINLPLAGTTFAVGDALAFAGSATDPEDGTLPAASLQWAVTVRHCPGGSCHTHPLSTAGGPSGTLTAPDHGDDSFLVFTLSATDSNGLTGSTSVNVHPSLVTITLQRDPPGLQVVFGGTPGLTPATFNAVVGSQRSVTMPSPQHTLSFSGWSSGAPRQHSLTVGTSNATYTAVFTPPPGVSYLGDLRWTNAVNGAGPVERNRSHGDAGANDGGPLTIRGVTYAKGLGVRAPSDLRFNLNGACTTFFTTAAIDDEVEGAGTVTVEIWLNGTLAVRSGLVTGVMAALSGGLDVTGVDELRLVVTDGGDSGVNDHFDWADARVECAGPGAAPPVAPGPLTALAAGQMAGLSWTAVPGARIYRLEGGSAPGAADYGTLDLAATSVAAPVPAGTYYLRVRALNAWGEGAPSPEAVLVVKGALRLRAAPDVPPGTDHVQVRGVNIAGSSPPSATVTIVVP